MGSHPVNLAVRFLLELAALVALGAWGWTKFPGAWRWPVTVGLPLVCMLVWGVFAVPGDPSRGGSPLVVVPGAVRLLLELAFFSCSTWALWSAGRTEAAWALGAVSVVHYALSWDRVLWLLAR